MAAFGAFAWPILGGGLTVFLFFSAFFMFLIAMDNPTQRKWVVRAIGFIVLGLVWSVCWLFMTVQCLIAWIPTLFN
jgi:hypothetical protein